MGVMVTMTIMLMMNLGRHSTDDRMLVVMMMVMMMMVVVVGLITSVDSTREQRFTLLLTLDPRLLDLKNCLFNGEDEEEAGAHDELSQGIININIVFALNLFQHL